MRSLILIGWFFTLNAACGYSEYGPFDEQGQCEKARQAMVVASGYTAELCVEK